MGINDGANILGTLYNEVTLDQVKEYLKVDFEEDDLLITGMIAAAQEFIYNYTESTTYFASGIPYSFTIALLTLVSHWYEQRMVIGEYSALVNELPWVFTGILNFYRGQNVGDDITRLGEPNWGVN